MGIVYGARSLEFGIARHGRLNEECILDCLDPNFPKTSRAEKEWILSSTEQSEVSYIHQVAMSCGVLFCTNDSQKEVSYAIMSILI